VHDKSSVLGLDWAFIVIWMAATTIAWLIGGFLGPGISLFLTGLAMGALQWIPLQKRLPQPARWIVATAAGWALAQIELILVNPGQAAFLTGIIVGLCVGIAQWLVLHSHYHFAGWWIVMNVVAWTTGFGLLPGAINTGMLPGFITAITLDLLLRSPKS
jgi:hypothetical protein